MAEVRDLLGPPPEEIATAGGGYAQLEARLGITFPVVYKSFLDTYGPGMVSGDIRLYHPTIPFPNFFTLDEFITHLLDLVELEPMFFAPELDVPRFDLGFGVGDLIPFGEALNWVGLYFIISEDEDWEVLEYSGGEYERSGLGFGPWFLRYLHGGGSESYYVTPKPERMPRQFMPAADFRRF